MNKKGIMQGRLTSSDGRGIQFFPNNYYEWQKEFSVVAEIGLDFIEWIVTNAPNPLLEGFYKINLINYYINSNNVSIDSICLDYFMDFYFDNKFNILYEKEKFEYIRESSIKLGCYLIVIPIYKKQMNIKIIKEILRDTLIQHPSMKIAFEFLDVGSIEGIEFIKDLNKEMFENKKSHYKFYYNIGCCFDIGNNCDKIIIDEMLNYAEKDLLYHIHIKEKDIFGKTVQLGKGVIGYSGWVKIFKFLKTIKYNRNYTLQVARGEDGDEKTTVQEQKEFIKSLLE